MTPIFNYQTLDVNLQKETRTLRVTLGKKAHHHLSLEVLFELESLLAWAMSRVEIHSILIDSHGQFFSKGHDKRVLSNLTEEQITKFNKKLQKITQAIGMLSQIVIVDLQEGARNVACELALAADIRICHRTCKVAFDHTKLGVLPCSGGISHLSSIIGQANTKNWLLSAMDISASKLEQSGFVFDSYTTQTRAEVTQNILESIHDQASVSRIQTKLGISENSREQIEKMMNFERQVSKAALISEDWKEKNIEDSMPAKSMKEAVKLTLIKNNNLSQ